MRVVSYSAVLLIAAILVSAQVIGQGTEMRAHPQERMMFATNRCLSKGGVGIVNTGLYIIVKSSKSDSNELIVKPTEETEERWKGNMVTKGEVVFVYMGKVWTSQNLPKEFDLSKAVIVSFENDKIRFYDFQATIGGYYDRISD
ncbi:MAG TPA: hypothetical protein VK805_11610 [Candidatus Baltobacteraceae bacterium]|nr:hypothetical protein [Candidatus Baltobacteraceae bacterium]